MKSIGAKTNHVLRDILPGEEVNNSYGPWFDFPFIERQTRLASDYYFNCNCSSCQVDVADYPHVLRCFACSGPIVVAHQTYIPTSCMQCNAVLENSSYRMLRVDKHRSNFLHLWRYFTQPSVLLEKEPLRNRRFVKNLDLLTDSIDYQLTYLYHRNRVLQRNLQLYCWLLLRIGKVCQAAFYGQNLVLNRVPNSVNARSTNSADKLTEEYLIVSFCLQLYSKFVNNYKQVTFEENELFDPNDALLEKANKFIDHFKDMPSMIIEQVDKMIGELKSKMNENRTKHDLCCLQILNNLKSK